MPSSPKSGILLAGVGLLCIASAFVAFIYRDSNGYAASAVSIFCLLFLYERFLSGSAKQLIGAIRTAGQARDILRSLNPDMVQKMVFQKSGFGVKELEDDFLSNEDIPELVKERAIFVAGITEILKSKGLSVEEINNWFIKESVMLYKNQSPLSILSANWHPNDAAALKVMEFATSSTNQATPPKQ